ncbi:restriction endonuclease subunit S [Flavobacterium sp. P4023]|uniref:Restriction endonuclease subunit S n=1 Tax=Flavobacterium flabelliforme TaxID=2816119 RepID=A0ABS5CTM8_9FLAO|nr:restriction endonuclease subunit S [Flavobacterium flabelliforme]MBP4141964.1 restriction endonuclease subunit S [Flavobacterium flabelliforme]
MKSNYKRLGDYIQEVNIRNKALIEAPLMGVSIKKVLMPSIANIIGTDMSTYKLIKKNQFAYGSVTSRNGDKISIALLEEHDNAMVSQAYTVFEAIDENELLPEYLMMWFRRPEFDRYARFMSHGSAREIFSWTEMRDTLLPIPSPEKQLEIVKEYNTIQNRISLNNQLITKLEETAQAIYKQWFVDFEFPDENGKPYRSNGGEMVFCEELAKEIPVGWDVGVIGDFCLCNDSTLSVRDQFETIEYLDTGNITNNEIEDIQFLNLEYDEIPSRAKRKVKHNDIIFSTVRPNLGHFGILKNTNDNMIVSTGFSVLQPKKSDISSELIYLTIIQEDNLQNLQAKAEMSVSTYPSIKPEDLLGINFILPNERVLNSANNIFESTYNLLATYQKEKKTLKLLSTLLNAKMTKVESGMETVEN